MKPPSPQRKNHRHYSYYLVTISFIIFVAVLYGEDLSCLLIRQRIQHQPQLQQQQQQEKSSSPAAAAAAVVEKKDSVILPFAVTAGTKRGGGCDVFEGKWVLDESTRPLYAEHECPYIQPQLTCQEHGRPDRGYQHWRWQPHGCPLPSFNATFMLEMLRGKRMLFVGDSLNRGQFVSMVCLLHRVIPDSGKSMETFGSLTVFSAKDYNATVEFYWAPFLLESNSDDAVVHRITDRIVRAGSIKKHAKHWEGADIIVFNTYLWWMTGQPMKILKGSVSGDMKDVKLVETEKAYRMALNSMVRWVEKNMDPRKTRVFFTSMSPSHRKSEDWGGEPGGNCYNETTPIEDHPSYSGSESSRGMMRATGELLSRRKSKWGFPDQVSLLNITQLSEYRKDAHTQIYKKQWTPPTPEQLGDPKTYADCTHWCLPGLQDTWNELLFANLFFPFQ